MGNLVIDQGSLLDSIEYNIQSVERDATEAGKELKAAEGYQKSTGKRKCIFLLLLIIFGLIIVLIFKPKRHRVEVSTPSPPSMTTTGESSFKEAGIGYVPNGPLPIDDVTLDPIGASLVSGVGSDEDDRLRRRLTKRRWRLRPR